MVAAMIYVHFKVTVCLHLSPNNRARSLSTLMAIVIKDPPHNAQLAMQVASAAFIDKGCRRRPQQLINKSSPFPQKKREAFFYIDTYHFLKRLLCIKFQRRKSHFFLTRDTINATKYSTLLGSSIKKGRFLWANLTLCYERFFALSTTSARP